MEKKEKLKENTKKWKAMNELKSCIKKVAHMPFLFALQFLLDF